MKGRCVMLSGNTVYSWKTSTTFLGVVVFLQITMTFSYSANYRNTLYAKDNIVKCFLQLLLCALRMKIDILCYAELKLAVDVLPCLTSIWFVMMILWCTMVSFISTTWNYSTQIKPGKYFGKKYKNVVVYVNAKSNYWYLTIDNNERIQAFCGTAHLSQQRLSLILHALDLISARRCTVTLLLIKNLLFEENTSKDLILKCTFSLDFE